MSELSMFSPATRAWFRDAFAGPTSAQQGAWQAIASGHHALVIAPTGSGKTLAAFLWALDRLASEPAPADPQQRCRVLYISPLKALAVDVERNLRSPLTGIRAASVRLGLADPHIQVGIRTGDTPANERRAFTRTPPDVLVTTPESLFLLLTSSARESLRGVRTVIVDEVHAMAGSKRGAHLAVSLARLDAFLPAPAQRIGLSATVRPVDEVSTFLAGGQPVEIVQPQAQKTVTVSVEVPVADMSVLGETTGEVSGSAAGAERRTSLWPAVEERIYALIQAHRSTIVFSNSRRLTERLTARLNELAAEPTAMEHFPAQAIGQSGVSSGAPPTIARAHHGSMSREQRTRVEEELKSGTLPCVVATSSLELGIDMGAVDLVIQVEAPPSVASGLQRVGRAGHHVGAVSHGVMLPKFRGDLVACAVVAERMAQGGIEEIRYPRNPLDVLAQHIVAMVAMEPMSVMELATIIRQAAPFSALPDEALFAVLDMLAGRYPSADFGELRARIIWDRITDELRGRPGAQRLAVTSGGTIPDRGLYTVMTPGTDDKPGSRVGELDEEMVYESRVGDTFLLGTSSWRVEDITHDRVIVTPAPGQPARMPFWKGDAPGRPLELGKAIGQFTRELSTMDESAKRARATAAGLDDWATDNLLAYLAEQQTATRHVPNDRVIVVERFRDELGDWRIVVHSPFGARINAPWALAITARLREQRGIEVHAAHADDGIVFRLPDAWDVDGSEVLPTAEDMLLDPTEVERIVLAELGSSALFAARFRECAARSLLLPRRNPSRRTPLWQQRQRSAQLLTVAARYPRFPVVLEAMRECAQDIYDLPGLRSLMSDIQQRSIVVAEVETPTPSPFAKSLLFGYVGIFLYGNDAPLAERKAAALSLDSALLAELLGTEAIRELLDPKVISEVVQQLQRLTEQGQARNHEEAADILHFLGDLSLIEAESRGISAEQLAELIAERRIIQVRIAGQERFLSIEDAGLVRDALGVALPVGIPEAFLTPTADPLGELVIRYARTHGPFTAGDIAHRFGLGIAVITGALEQAVSVNRLVKGAFRPLTEAHSSSGEDEYCDIEVLRRIRRASLARIRAEVEPVEPAALGRFLPAWHHIGRAQRVQATSAELLSIVEQLAGVPVPASALESLILPARLSDYHPALLDQLTASGEVIWTGSGNLSGGDGWIVLAPSELADLLLPEPETVGVDTPLHEAVKSAMDGGALFFRQLADKAGGFLIEQGGQTPDDAVIIAALWELVWAGIATNDTLAPLRTRLSGQGAAHKTVRRAPAGRYARLRTRPTLVSRAGPPTVAGRWSLVPPRSTDNTQRTHARTEILLERHGVLTKGALETERVVGGFSAVYRVLRAMEESGQVVRGYVVEGLGAAQFATRGAVDHLRTFSNPAGRQGKLEAVVLAATDPAQPYGAALNWPAVVGDGKHRPGRKAGALVVLVDGVPVLYVERGGRSLLSFTEQETVLRTGIHALAQAVRDGWLGQLAVQRADGAQALTSALAELLQEAGFRVTPQGLRLRS